MKILLTGSSSGVGQSLLTLLQQQHDVLAPSRLQLDLSNTEQILDYANDLSVDMLINCAGTGVGGKIEFTQHAPLDIINILTTNLLAPILLTRCVLSKNPHCRIVNITSTNNNHYYPNDLIYSLSKKALADFGKMLKVDYPRVDLLEIVLGLTKTNFNNNRYGNNPERFHDIYHYPCLDVTLVSQKIFTVIFDSNVKTLEISP